MLLNKVPVPITTDRATFFSSEDPEKPSHFFVLEEFEHAFPLSCNRCQALPIELKSISERFLHLSVLLIVSTSPVKLDLEHLLSFISERLFDPI